MSQIQRVLPVFRYIRNEEAIIYNKPGTEYVSAKSKAQK